MSRRNPGGSSPDYEVGYGRPPKATRFQPGRSGNPKGSRKRLKTVAETLQQELGKTVTVREGGVDRRISLQDAIIRSLVHDAARGVAHARRQLIAMLQQFPPDSASTTLGDGTLQPDEQAIIDSYIAKLSGAAPTKEAEKPEIGDSEEPGTHSEEEVDP